MEYYTSELANLIKARANLSHHLVRYVLIVMAGAGCRCVSVLRVRVRRR